MSIDFACPKCKKQYRVKDSLAGKGAKCAKCNHRLKVPKPAPKPAIVDDLATDNDLGDWFDAELSSTTLPPVASATAPSQQKQKPAARKSGKTCSACASPLADGAVLCVACGLDLRSGKKHETTKVVDDEIESKGAAAVKQTASLTRGAIFSTIGAALGAGIWVAVAIFIGVESGWIAIGLGAAAGAGMALGHEDNDGTTAGIIAGGISILGIVGAKFIIFEHFKSQAAELGFSLDALSAIAGEQITFGSLFGPIDGIFILLAVASAYKIGSGQMTD